MTEISLRYSMRLSDTIQRMTKMKYFSLLFLLSGFILGFITDLLLRQPVLGLNYLLFILVWVTVPLLFAWKKSIINLKHLLFASLALINGLLVFLRASTVVQTWSVLISMILLSLLTMSVFSKDFNSSPLLSRYLGGWVYILTSIVKLTRDVRLSLSKSSNKKIHVSKGFIYSFFLAIIFLWLFSSADTIFGSFFGWTHDLLRWLGNYLNQFDMQRLFSVGFWSAASLVILYALNVTNKNIFSVSLDIKRSLVHKDSSIILWTLIAIFGAFVLLQIRYLFIHTGLPNDITYAEYARQGYGQLLFATILTSVVIKWVISSVTFEKQKALKNIQILATILIVLNNIVLLSAWKRLHLYDSAYGLTWARFIALLGILCIALGSIALTLWVWERFSSKSLYAACWYVIVVVLTMAAIANPESIIAKKNIVELSKSHASLDINYLNGLSRDSWPSLCAYAKTYIQKTNSDDFNSLRLPDNQTFTIKNSGLSNHFTNSQTYTQRYRDCR